MISCLTVTAEGRLERVRRAAADFAHQTVDDAELVIVHDGGAVFQRCLEAVAAAHAPATIRVRREPAGHTLGWLRNRSVEHARHDIVCQWDDDDYYHPERLALQLQRLEASGADCCFLTDQLHLFTASGTMFWDDWRVEVPPMDLIQGTMMARRDRLGDYPDLGRGEDTELVRRLVRCGCRIARLVGFGWLTIYVYDGGNAWDFPHHAAISRWKRLPWTRLRGLEGVLRRELPRYRPPLGMVRLLHEAGAIEIDCGAAGA